MSSPQVKICGITRLEDAVMAASLGATAIGFVFWPASPRYIAPEAAARIARALPDAVRRVGVFVNASAREIAETARRVPLDVVQLHGDEDAASPMAGLPGPVAIFKSVSLQTDDDARRAMTLPPHVTVLVDAADAVRRGGTGVLANWALAARVAAVRPIVLAGGLTSANVASAVQAVHPWLIDVSSGVESAPGIKDHMRLQEFFTAMRTVTTASTSRSEPESDARAFLRPPAFGQRDPDARGYFGAFGGRFVPETLVAPVEELTAAYAEARRDPSFIAALMDLLGSFVGRATPLYETRRVTAGTGVRLFLKREDLAHTGAHKINNAVGQALLAQRMGKRRIVAETGAGQHGVATATACALLGLECVVYMGEEDMARQALNVFRMRVLGATVVGVDGGTRTLKDAINEAMRDWVAHADSTYYLLGSVLGPHPYPLMVREFQSVIGQEARAQILAAAGRLPDIAVACVGGGSNAMGLFDAFVDDAGVRLVGVEAGGRAIAPGEHAARFAGGSPGVLHGTRSQVLQDPHGNILPTHSVSAGLDYPSVGPEHAWLASIGRTEYDWIDDAAALDGFEWLARHEGILPALESSHAAAWVKRALPGWPAGTVVLMNLSGRGDKDVETVRRIMEARQ